MTGFYVVGGHRSDWKRWQDEIRYTAGCISRVCLEEERVEPVINYVSPPEACPEQNPSTVFKAATREGDRLYACTTTEVLIYQLPEFQQVGYLSMPCFNDVHHVRPCPDGNLLVASTGLDMVVMVSPTGETLHEWNVLGEDTWKRFSREIDYRKVPSTKPHRSHPNYLFLIGDDIWVTRFYQRDAICLTSPGKRIEIGLEAPHDGIVYEDRVYFTTVDGHIVIADAHSLQVERVIDLNAWNSAKKVLGWCRGIEVLDRDHIIVGFSRLRDTEWLDNIRWVQYKVGLRDTYGNLPTRVSLYDIRRGRLCWEYDLEPYGHNTVFSIHHV
ncbi:MAG TPA: hypothetical protein VNJ09_09060 [Chthonomonadales bacterium]|nr:hypothetical protein [Chthonomonadales bacterium]